MDDYDAAEGLITYYHIHGRREKSSHGPRKTNQMSTFKFFFLLSLAILTKTGLKCVILNTQCTYLTTKLKLNFGDLNLINQRNMTYHKREA